MHPRCGCGSCASASRGPHEQGDRRNPRPRSRERPAPRQDAGRHRLPRAAGGKTRDPRRARDPLPGDGEVLAPQYARAGPLDARLPSLRKSPWSQPKTSTLPGWACACPLATWTSSARGSATCWMVSASARRIPPLRPGRCSSWCIRIPTGPARQYTNDLAQITSGDLARAAAGSGRPGGQPGGALPRVLAAFQVAVRAAM